MRQRIGRVAELIDEKAARGAPRERLGEILIVVRMSFTHVGAGDHDLRAHRPGVQHLLPRHLVRHHEQRAVALAGADQCETEAGIAGGRLDDCAAGPQPPLSFRRLDHAARRSVLQRT